MSNEHQQGGPAALQLNAGLALPDRISTHLRQLAPHMMQREGVVLLREAQVENQHLRGLLLWALYHHQGACSPIGLPIRKALNIDVFAHLSEEEIVIARLASEYA